MPTEHNDSRLFMKNSSEQELRELAVQLRKPSGSNGLKTAEMMNKTNLTMTQSALEALAVTDGGTILEIGPGNGDHTVDLLKKAEQLTYIGVDISASMVAEATTRNSELIDAGIASFHLGDGETIPLSDNHIDYVMTVNTIYFWDKPEAYLAEIQRVMKPGASLSIAFVTKDFLQSLPFTKYGFASFTDDDIRKMSVSCGLTLECLEHHEDTVTSKSGDEVNRQFVVAHLQKPLRQKQPR